MDVRDYVADTITRTRTNTVNMVQGLTTEQLTWQIAPGANTIGFLLFHTFRVEDYFLRVLGADQELWRRDGWDQRWTLPDPPDDVTGIWFTGNSWTPEDVASAALYLASDESAWVTGTSLIVDGGYTAQ